MQVAGHAPTLPIAQLAGPHDGFVAVIWRNDYRPAVAGARKDAQKVSAAGPLMTAARSAGSNQDKAAFL